MEAAKPRQWPLLTSTRPNADGPLSAPKETHDAQRFGKKIAKGMIRLAIVNGNNYGHKHLKFINKNSM